MRRPLLAVAGLALAILAAGCASNKKLVCPGVVVAPDLDSIAIFRPDGGQDLADITYGAVMNAPSSRCTTEQNGINVATRIPFLVARNGTAVKTGEITYFVAVADAQRNILAKQTFTLAIEFVPREDRRQLAEEITEHIPTDPAAGGNYVIIVGFQLTPEQLEHNRKRHGG